MSTPPELCLVCACYNEGSWLPQNIEEIIRVLEATRISYELIFVDDASTDSTRSWIQQILQKNQGRVSMKAIFHEKNTGRGGAVRDGFLAATGHVVGYIDVDLEVPAHFILACLLAIRTGHDVVVGKRIYKFKWHSVDRFVVSKVYAYLVHKLLRLNGLTDTESGYKFFRREKVVPLLSWCQETGWFWDTEIMAISHMAGLKIVEVPCLFLRRSDKISSVRVVRDSLDYLGKLFLFLGRRKELRRVAFHGQNNS